MINYGSNIYECGAFFKSALIGGLKISTPKVGVKLERVDNYKVWEGVSVGYHWPFK